MGDPILLAVEADAAVLRDVERELNDRYARHYRVVCVGDPMLAAELLGSWAATGDGVALVIAGPDLDGMTGSELLAGVRRTHPHARRALMIAWGDWGQRPTGEVIFDGIAHARFDQHVLRPAQSPDELFHETISGMLLDWAEATSSFPYTIRIVGESWSGRAYELRETLQQCAVPHQFHLADSEEGRSLVALGGEQTEFPLIVFPNGTTLENPTNVELARAAGSPMVPRRESYDVVIVGAGPAGLSAAVYGASEGFGTLVIDSGGIGGQAASSSLIRNYLGFSRGISGRQLARSAYDQAWVFGAEFTFMQAVTGFVGDGDEFVVSLADLPSVRTKAVLLATGASYRRIGVPALEALTGAGVFYGGPTSEAALVAGGDVFIVGGANSAGQAALHLARYARRVTLVVRGQSLRAGMSDYLVVQVESTDNVDVRLRTEVVDGGGDGRLEQLVLRDLASGREERADAQALFLLIGAHPHTEWLPSAIERDPNGFVFTGALVSPDASEPVGRERFDLETSVPGVFAAGDVRHGSVKRVASAVGEGSIAVSLLHRYFSALGHEPRGRLRGQAAPIV